LNLAGREARWIWHHGRRLCRARHRVARFANGILYNAEVNRLDARDRRPANEHALAAAIRGEIVAMANWISTQAASLQENTRPQDNADLNDDMPNERLGSSSLPARPIYESNANRSYICGGVLSETVPYTYAPVWNRPSWKRPVKYEPNSVELRLKRLQNAEVTAGVLVGHLCAYIVGKLVPNNLPTTSRKFMKIRLGLNRLASL
jgi:hypothetical protein